MNDVDAVYQSLLEICLLRKTNDVFETLWQSAQTLSLSFAVLAFRPFLDFQWVAAVWNSHKERSRIDSR